MAEFLGSPLASVVLLLALTATLIAIGVYVIGKVRESVRRPEPDASAWLTKFRDLHARGELSDEEFRSIRTMLAERLQEEMGEANEGS